MEELPKPSKSSHRGIRVQCTNRRAADCPKGTVLPKKWLLYALAGLAVLRLRVPSPKSAQIFTATWTEAWRCSWLRSCTNTAARVLARAGSFGAFQHYSWSVRLSVSKAVSYRNYPERLNPTRPFVLSAFVNVCLRRALFSLVFLTHYADLGQASLHPQSYIFF